MKRSSLVIVYHRQPNEEVVENGRIVYRTHKSPNGIVPTLKSFFNRLEPDAGAWIASKVYDPEKGVDFEEYDISLGGPKRVEMIDRAHGRSTVPQIFIDGAHIGGSDDLMALEASGKLDALLGA